MRVSCPIVTPRLTKTCSPSSAPDAIDAARADERAGAERGERRDVRRRMHERMEHEIEALAEFRGERGARGRGRPEQVQLALRRPEGGQRLNDRRRAQGRKARHADGDGHAALVVVLGKMRDHLDGHEPVGERAVEKVGQDVARPEDHQSILAIAGHDARAGPSSTAAIRSGQARARSVAGASSRRLRRLGNRRPRRGARNGLHRLVVHRAPAAR